MYLSELEVIGLTIALVTSVALIITSATANARLTRQRDEWRDDALWYNAVADEHYEEIARLHNIINSTSPLRKG